jgi:hypothetical protein
MTTNCVKPTATTGICLLLLSASLGTRTWGQSSGPTQTGGTVPCEAETQASVQTRLDELRQALILEQQRCEAADKQIWTNTDIAGRDVYNFNLSLFFGRAEDWEKLTKTLDEAGMECESGLGTYCLSRTLAVFKQAKDLASRVGGVLAPAPYTKVPTNPKEARDFVRAEKDTVKQLGADSRGGLNALGRAGNAMAEHGESCIANQTSIRNQMADLEKRMMYAPSKSSVTSAAVPCTPRGDAISSTGKDAVKTSSNAASSTARGPAFNYDAERQKLVDAISAANGNVQRVAQECQACLDGCQHVPWERQLSCVQSCEAPSKRAQAEFDKATNRLYQFERDNNFGTRKDDSPPQK